jgi:predicted nucleic acid-binding protein
MPVAYSGTSKTKMPERLLLDTDVVIHLMKKHPNTVDHFVELKEGGTTFLLSPIVIAELYAGAFKHEHRQIEAFFGLCQPLTLDGEVARIAGHYANRYRKAFQGISLEDYLLAATARQHHCPLWTGNRKHYPMDDIKLFATE